MSSSETQTTEGIGFDEHVRRPGKTKSSSSCQSRPLVSVCIPAFQAERFLQATVESVLAQDYPNLEIVVVDNNSSDGTRDILDSISDDRLRIIRNATTLSAVDNFNFAVQQSKGEFVKFICADDTLKPNCISEQAAVLEDDPEVVLVSAKLDFIDEAGELIIPARGLSGIEGRLPAERVMKRIIRSGCNPIGPPVAAMFRRIDFDRCGGFRAEFPFVIDMELWVRLLHGGDFFGLPRTLGSFRVQRESISGLTPARAQLAQQIEFGRLLADDPRWNISVADRIRGRVRSYEHQVRRTLLFTMANWRASRGSHVPVVSRGAESRRD